MNATTTASLERLRDYWRDEGDPYPEVAAIDRLLAEPPALTDEQYAEWFERLEGPEGCDFKDGDDGITWTCAGGTDKSKSQAILAAMGVADPEAARALALADLLGGHCDCEVLFNAAGRILPEGDADA